MRVVSTKTSSKGLTSRGSSLQPSEPDVVALSIRTELPSFGDCNPETVKALTAMILALLRNVLSGDVICLSTYAARDMAKRAGVSDEEFERVLKTLMEYWAASKARNPLGSMF